MGDPAGSCCSTPLATEDGPGRRSSVSKPTGGQGRNRHTNAVGGSYHNVYKWADQVGDVDASEWCNGGVATAFPDREPYNLGGGIPVGGSRDAYYKIWDVTNDVWVCGSDG